MKSHRERQQGLTEEEPERQRIATGAMGAAARVSGMQTRAHSQVTRRHPNTHLGVPPGDVEDHGVAGARDQAAHFDVAHAVVDGQQGDPPELGQHAGDHGAGHQGATHAGALGEGDGGDVAGRDTRLLEGALDQGQGPLLVVQGCFPGQEAVAGGGDVPAAREA